MRILVFNGGGIGDAVLGSIMLSDIRGKYPKAELYCVVSGSAQRDLVERTALCDQVIKEPVNKTGSSSRGRSLLSHILEFRRTRFDLALMTFQSRGFWNSFITCAAGIKRRYGFDQMKSHLFLNKVIPIEPARHVVQYNTDLLRLAGIDSSFKYPVLKMTSAEKSTADDLLVRNRINRHDIVVLHGGAGFKGKAKRVSAEKLVEVAQGIVERHPGSRFIYPDVNEYENTTCFTRIDAVPFSVREGIMFTVALLQKASLCISSDSGIMHLAAMCGIPVVGLFGPTDPAHTGPFAAHSRVVKTSRTCSPCLSYRDTGKESNHLVKCNCMSFIESESVVQSALELMEPDSSTRLISERTSPVNAKIPHNLG